jgi:formylglycine-generating enzyme required for sulfatase activity
MTIASTLAVSAASLFATALAIASPVTMDWVTVGNAGSAADPTTGLSSVGYEYRIGTYEVTNAQYAAFLNSVAASDPNELYSTQMSSNPRGGITRSGSDGSYTYSVRPNMGDKPVNFVSWYDAARMANWMTNGQGSGGTDTGVYTFTGATSISTINRDLSIPNTVFIPTEDEWYKAAYHQPASQGGDADDYWLYATQSNSVPTIASATGIGDVANPGQNVVNYAFGAVWNGQNGNFTTAGSAGSTSFYGAFDMNGNILEWNETPFGSSRVLRGGSYNFSEFFLRSSSRFNVNPTVEDFNFGFRLASSVPRPACPADLNGDGVLDFGDVGLFVTFFASDDLAADLNGDGLLDFGDVGLFVTAFNAGC